MLYILLAHIHFDETYSRGLRPVPAMDYGCEGGRLVVPATCVTVSNPDLLSSSEQGVHPGITSWKNHSSE
jgi:hypothetical protein